MKTKTPKRPPRTQSQLFKLEERIREQLIDWMLEGYLYSEIEEKLKDILPEEKKKKLTIRQLKWFWTVVGVVVDDWQKTRPKNLSPVGWEHVRRQHEKALLKPDLTAEEAQAHAAFLRTGGRMDYKKVRTEPGVETPGETNAAKAKADAEAEEINPLDDDEKMRQVRIEVFGSAPE